MYPVIRTMKELIVNRSQPKLHPLAAHVSYHRCWPQDIDVYLEMNNGRILTIMDLGRTGLGIRTGLVAALRRNGWGLTMAGASVRYRKRIRPFTRFRMVSKCIGWDDKFMYLDQSIWIGDNCAVQILYRSAATGKTGIVKPDHLLAEMGMNSPSPALPDWVQGWIDADRGRTWPPVDYGAQS
ncbi:acyl-CoA thioesterase [Yoonia sp.]|uniref:acyl-CoA thioesterase n=1 Tax=Yoonia sp. TaxID=2212373 RepID=UPI00391DA68C